MNINNCVKIFNAMLQGNPVSLYDDLFPLISDFLTENNIENSDKIMILIKQNPHLIQETLPTILEYYINKYNICSISFNNKKILYYVTTKNN